MAETVSADVVVIGSGATGMAAALTAAEGGASVILLEKVRHVGEAPTLPRGCSEWKPKCSVRIISA